MTDQDSDLEALFARPAPLADSQRLLLDILVKIDRQQRRRSLLLWSAAFAGAMPVLLLAVAAWPVIASGFDALTATMDALLGRGLALPKLPQISQTHAQYGVWILAALGLLVTGIAALRSQSSR